MHYNHTNSIKENQKHFKTCFTFHSKNGGGRCESKMTSALKPPVGNHVLYLCNHLSIFIIDFSQDLKKNPLKLYALQCALSPRRYCRRRRAMNQPNLIPGSRAIPTRAYACIKTWAHTRSNHCSPARTQIIFLT